MAGYGPPPADEKRRRNADTFDEAEVVVAQDETATAPKLPSAHKYLKATRDWYEAWTKAPQAAAFLATDWTRLHMLAPIVDAYWRDPDTKLLAEIRLNESLLGGTHVDRMRGRIKVTAPKASAPEATSSSAGSNVTSIEDRRARLLANDA